MNCEASFCWSIVGRSGYAPAIVCSNVHDDWPNCSTSGGQSDGESRCDVAEAGGVVGSAWLAGTTTAFFIIVFHDADDVQERHGLPSGPKTTPLGRLLGSHSLSCLFSVSTGITGSPVRFSTIQKNRERMGNQMSVVGMSSWIGNYRRF